MEVFDKLEIKIPHAVLVNGINEPLLLVDVIAFLEQYGDINKTSPLKTLNQSLMNVLLLNLILSQHL